MPFGAAVADLHAHLNQLEQTFDHLRFAVRSRQADHQLAFRLDNLSADLMGMTVEAQSSVGSGQLVQCQAQLNRIAFRFWSELMAFTPMSEVVRLGEERSRKWADWCAGVRDALDGCALPLYECSESLIECWQELVAQPIGGSVSLRPTIAGSPVAATPFPQAID